MKMNRLAGFKNAAIIRPLITTCEIWPCVLYYLYHGRLSQFPVQLINGVQSLCVIITSAVPISSNQ